MEATDKTKQTNDDKSSTVLAAVTKVKNFSECSHAAAALISS